MRITKKAFLVVVMLASSMSNASDPWEAEDSEKHSHSSGHIERGLGDFDATSSGGDQGDATSGFLSSGLFGTYSQLGSLDREQLPLQTTDDYETDNNSYLSSFENYQNSGHGGGLNWVFHGGFPISCVPKETGSTSGTNQFQSISHDDNESHYLYGENFQPYNIYAKAKGKGLGKSEGKGFSKSKSKSKGKGTGKGKSQHQSKSTMTTEDTESYTSKTSKTGKGMGKGKGSDSQHEDISFVIDNNQQSEPAQSLGWLSRAQYFRNVARTKQHPNGGALGDYGDDRRDRHTERTEVSGFDCYFGAFPRFSGIPEMPRTNLPKMQPTIFPSQGPTQAPSLSLAPSSKATSFPTQATAAPTPIRTASPTTLIPTNLPTQQALEPLPATATPSAATAAPSLATSAPTGATIAPTSATNAPTAATSAPTGVTAAPTVATSAPTNATSAPTVQVLSRTLASELSYGTLGRQATVFYFPVAVTDTSPSHCILGFFADAEPQRAPTDIEISGLIEQTIPFYAGLFKREYGDTFEKFDLICTFPSPFVFFPRC
jgi:hypothetical protein